MAIPSASDGAWRWLLPVVMGGWALGAADPAHAVSCGEVVGPGERRVLTKNLTCEESPALTVEGPVVLDLRGFSVTCTRTEAGALRATGIQVTGSQAEVRNGKVKNCHRGVDVRGDGNHLIERLTVTSAAEAGGSDHIGVLVRSDDNQLLRNVVRNYAGEGFRLDGADRGTLNRNQAIGNADHGFRVRQGRGNVFWRNKAQGNQGEGFRSQDRDNRFEANTALNNGDEGIRLRDGAAQNNVVIDNVVNKNGRSPCDPLLESPDANPGIAVTRGSGSNLISGNKLSGNCIGIGIEDGSRDNTVTGNNVANSKLFDLVDGNRDCDNNTWDDNKFKTGTSGPLSSDALLANFPRGVLFSDCIGDGQPLISLASPNGLIGNGESLAKDGVSAVENALSAAKNATRSLISGSPF